ncbi:MAG: alternative ribosome rescue aminoacyl-tRNA hydrolase ArfB [Phycisphaerae bacterium]
MALQISKDELVFTATRSSGPGGQNVNKVSTRVILSFDVINSPSLTDDQKLLIRNRLATRINKEGILRVVSQQTRSQAENRQIALERFIELLQEALKRMPIRKKTKITRSAQHRRLVGKKQRSRLKERRKQVDDSD